MSGSVFLSRRPNLKTTPQSLAGEFREFILGECFGMGLDFGDGLGHWSSLPAAQASPILRNHEHGVMAFSCRCL